MNCLVQSALVCYFVADDPPSAQDLFARVKAARRALTTGEVECRITSWPGRGKQPAEQHSSLRHWWTQNSGRGDCVRPFGAFAGTREVWCRNCEAPGYGIWYADRPRLAVNVFRLTESSAPPLHAAGDIRLIGLTPNDLFGTMNFSNRWDALFDPAKAPVKASVTMSATELDGRPCWRVLFAYENGVQETVWIDSARGPGVVRLENRSGLGVREVVSELQQVAGTEHWFPRRVRFADRNGDTEREWEVVEVSKVRVNVPIPPETFTVAGIRPLEGVGADIPGKGFMWYVGGKMVPAGRPKNAGLVEPPPESAPPRPVDPAAVRTVNPWLVAVCLASALAAVGLLLFRRR